LAASTLKSYSVHGSRKCVRKFVPAAKHHRLTIHCYQRKHALQAVKNVNKDLWGFLSDIFSACNTTLLTGFSYLNKHSFIPVAYKHSFLRQLLTSAISPGVKWLMKCGNSLTLGIG
jgi:hypothetical protein